ncbi:MAG: hypothetical protein JNG88_09160 [Phycisphaerales bacterium]|nr:hypothetical protein [Phycisphaerales bacterium]
MNKPIRSSRSFWTARNRGHKTACAGSWSRQRSLATSLCAALLCWSALFGCAATDATATSQPARAAPATMRVRLASDRQRAGYILMSDRVGRSYYVSARDELTERDVHLARAYHAQNDSMVELILRPAAAARFATLTREQVGSWIAFVVDEQLVSAALVQSEIHSGVAYISGLAPQEAERLAASLCKQQPSSDDPMRG